MFQNNYSYLLRPMPSGSRSEDPDGTEIFHPSRNQKLANMAEIYQAMLSLLAFLEPKRLEIVGG